MCLHSKYRLPDGYDQQRVVDALARDFSISAEWSASKRYAFYDTFDWRLFNKSLALYQSGSTLSLCALDEGNSICGIDVASSPVFVRDIAESELRSRLEPIVRMRALLQLAETQAQTTIYRILNRDEKTVSRLIVEEFRLPLEGEEPMQAGYLWIQPVRGYPKYSQKLMGRCKEMGCAFCQKEDVYGKILEMAGKQPGSYSSKFTLRLVPDMPSEEATRVILRYLLQAVTVNGEYIKQDIDTEFLHDFRVAVRRIRSALGQIESVFPPKIVKRFKKNFAFVGRFSNRLRDLDVYLLKENRFKAMLSPLLSEDIAPLFRYLRAKRAEAFREVVEHLESEKYKRILEKWEAFLNEPPQNGAKTANARIPIVDLARSSIDRQYRHIVESRDPTPQQTKDEELHAIRIECKKLRYLMDFFSSLFSKRKIRTLLRKLKALQDNLGDFNDLCIQEEYLLAVAEELPVAAHEVSKTLIAINSLVESLKGMKRSSRNTFFQIFSDFASPGMKKKFHELCAR